MTKTKLYEQFPEEVISKGFKDASLKYDFRDKTLKPKSVATDMFTEGVKWAVENMPAQEPEVKEVEVIEEVEVVKEPEKKDYTDAIEKIYNWVFFEIKSNFQCTMTQQRRDDLKSFLKMVLEQ